MTFIVLAVVTLITNRSSGVDVSDYNLGAFI